MNVLVLLIPISLILGGLGLLGFIWTLRARQYDDPDGHAARILIDGTPHADGKGSVGNGAVRED